MLLALGSILVFLDENSVSIDLGKKYVFVHFLNSKTFILNLVFLRLRKYYISLNFLSENEPRATAWWTYYKGMEILV